MMHIHFSDEKIALCLTELAPETKDMISYFVRFLRRKNYSPATIERRLYHLRDFFRYIQSVPAGITRHDVDRFIDYKQDLGNVPLSINGHLSSIRQFYIYLIMEDLVTKNPVVIKRHYLKVPKSYPRNMSESDVERFFRSDLSIRDLAIFLLMLRCGLRTGEVTRLKVSDINFESQRLRVVDSKYQYSRIGYFSEEVKLSLENWLKVRAEHTNLYLFTTPRTAQKNMPMALNIIQNSFHVYRQQAGISAEKGYTPHSFRHTYATQLINAGIPITSLKELMGHRCISDTMRYVKVYSKTVRDQYFRAMSQIESKSNHGESHDPESSP